ncbi:DUF5681 domain-containing protein [Novosphingobium sp.]|uniref:DUF5681 domain-containing protein n=1 Tax=Novosphingobium sp. TaxID=1874826 RepID=UPI0038F75F05
MTEERDCEVDKGKPPEATQFKPGQSGNPAGARRHKRRKGGYILGTVRAASDHRKAGSACRRKGTFMPIIQPQAARRPRPTGGHTIAKPRPSPNPHSQEPDETRVVHIRV